MARGGARFALWLGVLAGGALAAAPERVRAQDCAKAEFEAVVEAAASALRELNQKNKPLFQGRLKELREKRNWSPDQFLKEAAPLVQDDKIAEFDQRSQEFLERIQSVGAETPADKAQGCKVLTDVRGYMKSLVEVQTAKWAYMFGRVEQELKK